MINFFKRNSLVEKRMDFALVRNQIKTAFTRIKYDVSDINSQLIENKAELHRLNAWVDHLNKSSSSQNSNHSEVSNQLSVMKKSHHDLNQKHAELSSALNSTHSNLSGEHNLTKQDIHNLKQWINHFAQLFQQQRVKESNLRTELTQVQNLFESTLDNHKSELSNIKTENESLKQQIVEIQESFNSQPDSDFADEPERVVSQIAQVQPQFSQSVPQQVPTLNIPSQPQIIPHAYQSDLASGFEKHFMRRIRPNRKHYVMEQILKMASEQEFTTREIEDVIVGEKQLCGRTTFFAYLKELRITGKIDNAEIAGRTLVITK